MWNKRDIQTKGNLQIIQLDADGLALISRKELGEKAKEDKWNQSK